LRNKYMGFQSTKTPRSKTAPRFRHERDFQRRSASPIAGGSQEQALVDAPDHPDALGERGRK
jgi:hypothetical protein